MNETMGEPMKARGKKRKMVKRLIFWILGILSLGAEGWVDRFGVKGWGSLLQTAVGLKTGAVPGQPGVE